MIDVSKIRVSELYDPGPPEHEDGHATKQYPTLLRSIIARIAGATFAATEISPNQVKILHGGDTRFLVIFKDGRICMPQVQSYEYEHTLNTKIGFLMNEVALEKGIHLDSATDEELRGIRAEMWNRFCPILREARAVTMNIDYADLNGESTIQRKWLTYTFPIDEIAHLILFTDGLVPWKFVEFMPNDTLAVFLTEMYKSVGINGILKFTRSAEVALRRTYYTSKAEATAVTFDFP